MRRKNETINDIEREMREFADTDSQTMGRDVLRRQIHRFADRIKAAYKREIEILTADRDNWRRQALAEDERANAAETVIDRNRPIGKTVRKFQFIDHKGMPIFEEEVEVLEDTGTDDGERREVGVEKNATTTYGEVRELVPNRNKLVDKTVTDCNGLNTNPAENVNSEKVIYNNAKMRDALECIANNLENRLFGRYSCSATDEWMLQKARAALAEPPRYCDVVSLKAAKKLWFLKEMVPRLYGNLPLGTEVPFEEWFVSKIEQETKGDNDEQK